MKKSELKTNMLVETRNHRRYLVKKDLPYDKKDLFVRKKGGFLKIDEYNENLLYHDKILNGYDIMKVYKPHSIFAFLPESEFDLDNYTLLWERENSEVTKLRKEIEEIEKLLNDKKTLLAKTLCKDEIDEDIKKLKDELFAKSEERNMV